VKLAGDSSHCTKTLILESHCRSSHQPFGFSFSSLFPFYFHGLRSQDGLITWRTAFTQDFQIRLKLHHLATFEPYIGLDIPEKTQALNLALQLVTSTTKHLIHLQTRNNMFSTTTIVIVAIPLNYADNTNSGPSEPMYSFLLSNFDSKFQNLKHLLNRFLKYEPRPSISQLIPTRNGIIVKSPDPNLATTI